MFSRVVHPATFASFLLIGCTASLGADDPGEDNGLGDPPGGGIGDPGGDRDPVCDQVEPIQIVEAQPPDLLLVVDKSGSMNDELDTGDDKWPVMRGALQTITAQYDTGINFGLMLYPTGAECAAGAVRAGVAAQNSGAIANQLGGVDPEGGTPTHTTIDAALAYYESIAVNPNGRYALLATDGQPNCHDLDDPNDPAVQQSIDAITRLSQAGIPTFVLGFGSGINNDPTTLQAMAEAGGTDQFYAANSPAQLQAALEAIAGSVTLPPCSFNLAERPGDDSLLEVFFDAAAVPRDPTRATGWDYDLATNSITFYGETCEQLQSGGVSSVRVDYGCGNGPIVE